MTRPIDRIAAILGSLPLATAGARSAAAEARPGDGHGRAEWEQRYYRDEIAALSR